MMELPEDPVGPMPSSGQTKIDESRRNSLYSVKTTKNMFNIGLRLPVYNLAWPFAQGSNHG
jgi:hypothetical protein